MIRYHPPTWSIKTTAIALSWLGVTLWGVPQLPATETSAGENCPTWETFREAVRSGKISLEVPIPNLPEGFRQGCISSELGAHTLNIFVYREGIEPKYIETNSGRDSLYQILPPADGIAHPSELPEQQIHTIHFGFDSGASYTKLVDKYQAWQEPYITAGGTVYFRYTWATLKPEGLPARQVASTLEELAFLLKQTRDEYDPQAKAKFAEKQSNAVERTCLAPVYRVKSRFDKVAGVKVQRSKTELIQDLYEEENLYEEGAPTNKPKHVSIFIRGNQPETIMQSKSMLQYASQEILNQCDGVGLLTIGVWGSGYVQRYGWVDGDIQPFRCRQPGLNTNLQWGEQFCGL